MLAEVTALRRDLDASEQAREGLEAALAALRDGRAAASALAAADMTEAEARVAAVQVCPSPLAVPHRALFTYCRALFALLWLTLLLLFLVICCCCACFACVADVGMSGVGGGARGAAPGRAAGAGGRSAVAQGAWAGVCLCPTASHEAYVIEY